MSTTRKSYDAVKRGIDILGACFGLVLLAPILAFVAIAVQLRLGSPVFIRQMRPGRYGQEFVMYKFRTVLEDDESKRLVTDEERMTPFGSWLRSTSLDELPTLWNVLKGDMSLVGPRPLMVEYLGLDAPEQARRHEVRPGVTGTAQVSGRSGLSWEAKFALDLEYVDERSLARDVRILLSTVVVILGRVGMASAGEGTATTFVGGRQPTVVPGD